MTDKNTIDGVPRELLETIEKSWRIPAGCPASVRDEVAAKIGGGLTELRALLAEPALCCTHTGDSCQHCDGSGWAAAKPPGEPIKLGLLDPAQRLAVARGEQITPVSVVPDGYCIMPRQLTAENGAKALLLGEFKLQVTKECPECCELEEPTEGCVICDGEGEYEQQHTISWDQIKFIYSKAVSGLAVKAESAKSR